MTRRTALACGLACGLALLAAGAARADERPLRRVGLHRAGGLLAVSVGLPDLLLPTEAGRLRSGLASRILIRIELVREAPGPAVVVARAFRASDLAYDVWDERFRVRVWERHGAEPRVSEVGGAETAVAIATGLVRFPVADGGLLARGSSYHLRFRADLNPLSEETAADVRRWLVRPPGQGRSAGESVFGSFISIFVNPQIEESERKLLFRSQSFGAPPS